MPTINSYLSTSILFMIIVLIAPWALLQIKHQVIDKLEPHNKIGYLKINGPIDNAAVYRAYLINYFQDPSIKAILLSIESVGGAAGSCQALAFDIENFKKEFPKPIITYTENLCTAGAYEIAAATDYIVASGSAIIGNLNNNFTSMQNLHELISQYTLHEKTIDTSTIERLAPEQKTILQSLADNSYQQLCKDIARKRHVQLNKIDQWACGKVVTGQQAYDLKLVDAIGSKTTAINLIKKNIIPSDYRIEWVTPPARTIFNMIWGYSTINEEHNLDQVSTGVFT